MTNNPTIDGVSRELLERVATESDHMLGFTYASNCDECRSAVDQLRALLDAPVVERQPVAEWCDSLQLKAIIKAVVARERMRPASLPDSEVAEAVYEAITEHLPVYEDVYDQLSEIIEPHVKRPYRLDAPLPASVVDSMGFLLKAYTDSPEVAALQSTIAQLQTRVAELESGRGEPAYYRVHTPRVTVAGEVLEWWPSPINYTKEDMAKIVGPYKIVEELFTAPPAPVAAVPSLWEIRVPDEPQNPESPAEYLYAQGVANRDLLLLREGATVVAEYACLDATAALNEVKL